MKKSMLLTLSVILLLLSCSTPGIRFDPSRLSEAEKNYFGSSLTIGPRLLFLSELGAPLWSGEKIVFEWEDLFSINYPPRQEVWLWDSVTVYFQSPIEVWWDYRPPQIGNGDLRIQVLDTCWTNDEFCIVFFVDGLEMAQQCQTLQTLWRGQLFIWSNNRWWYLYDMSPTVGNKGLRALEATVFISYETLEKYKKRGSSTALLLFVFRDFFGAT